MIVTLAKGLLYSTLSNLPVQTPQQIAEKALAATVFLDMQDSNGAPLNWGSGFFVGHNLIATNHHVIKAAARGTAKIVGQETKFSIEGITAKDETNDLALLKVTMQGVNPLPLGDSATVRIGDTVYVAGSPGRWEGTFSNGIISGLREEPARKQLQMTAPISPGSSGGPVLNDKGKVIGVSARAHEGQNLNFASHSNALKDLLERSGLVTPLAQQNHTTSVHTYLTQGFNKEKLRDYKGAIVNYTEAIRLQPDYTYAYFKRGLAKARLARYVDAINDFDTVLRVQSNYVAAYLSRGIAKYQLGQYRSTIADCNAAICLQPDCAQAYLSRGLAQAALKRHEEAITNYDTAIRLNPDYDIAYSERGLAKANLGQYAAAIADYDTAIRLKPHYAIAYTRRGSAKNKLGKHGAAIADYDIAIRLRSNDALIYNNRGLAKAKLGKHRAAIADYDMAIQLEPNQCEAYFGRGSAKATLRQHGAAIADFDIVIRLKPGHALAYSARARSKLSLGRTSEAKQDLRTTSRLIETTNDQSLQTRIELLLQRIDR